MCTGGQSVLHKEKETKNKDWAEGSENSWLQEPVDRVPEEQEGGASALTSSSCSLG